ncbi:MAG: hypothetical protein AAB426_03505 [Myxococcota bacterium]
MVERRDKDQLERGPLPPTAPRAHPGAPATLPTREPEGRSLTEQRQDLVRLLEELEGTLRYMGQAHPQRQASEQRRAHLRTLLEQIDAALAVGRTPA